MSADIPAGCTPSTTGWGRAGSARAWVACGAISLGLHASMLATVPGARGGSEAASAGTPMVVQLAMTAPSKAALVEASWNPAPLVPHAQLRRPEAPKLLPMSSAEWHTTAFDESAYLPARQLTVRPTAAQRISVPYPRDATQGVRKAVLAIFIDEDGRVAKVRVDDALPPAFERAAVDAFASARFHPGRVGNIAVKSRMLVQVEFDSGPPPNAVEPPRLAAVPGKR